MRAHWCSKDVFKSVKVVWLWLRLIAASLGIFFSVSEVLAWPMDPLSDQPGFEGGKVLQGAAAASSIVLADLNGDIQEEIIVGGSDGWVYAVLSDGTLLWQFSAGDAISAAARSPGGGRIEATPAVADLDGDGWNEVVVAIVPPSDKLVNHNGGIVVLDHSGVLQPGWPQLTLDNTQDGFAEGVFSSPSVGDLDGDGDLEIVAGSWDMHVYAWHHDGQLVDGWPRFTAETVFSSPAIADLDDDGHFEVIIGLESHEYPPMNLLDGGYLYVYRGDGSVLSGFPKYIEQTIDSSPAIGDLDGDGALDIVVGTGTWFAEKGYAIYAWDRYGNPLSGWPVSTGGYVLSSPSLGDIDGDGLPEVIVGCNDGKIYAFNADGTRVLGWPVVLSDNFGNPGSVSWASPVLANFDSDPLPEVFINHWCDTVVLDGDGTYLTHIGDTPDGKPTIWMGNVWCPHTTPAVGDIDKDDKLEIIRAGGDDLYNQGNLLLRVWESDRTPASVTWPMFRYDSAHYALFRQAPETDAEVISHTLPKIMAPGTSHRAYITLKNTGTDPWLEASFDRLAALPNDPLAVETRAYLDSGESISPGQQKIFSVTLQAPDALGYYTTEWRMIREGEAFFGRSVVQRVKVGNEPSFYVLYRNEEGSSNASGGVYAGGLALSVSAPLGLENWWVVQSLGFVPQRPNQYFILDSYGTIWCGGNRDCFGSHAPWGIEAQEILMLDHGKSFYVLDKYGNIYNGYGAYSISPLPLTFSDPIIRSAALTPDERGIYVLDGYGNVHTGGTAPTLSPTTPNFDADIAQRIKLTADGTGYYVLDAYGRVWNGGTATTIETNYEPHIGEDWARDFELTADGQGYYLLDKEGNIYTGGTAVTPTVNLPPVWPGQDVAVDLAVADSRVLKAPMLAVTPGQLAFMTIPGQTRSAALQISNAGDGTLNWSADSDQDWLTVTPESGSAPAALTISVDPASLLVGSYEATITIDSEEAANSPISIPVHLYVVETIYPIYLPLVSR